MSKLPIGSELRSNFPYDSATHVAVGQIAAAGRCAVEIPRRIKRNCTYRTASVGAAGEVVQRGIAPPTVAQWRQLEHGPAIISSVGKGGSIKISGAVKSQLVRGSPERPIIAGSRDEVIEEIGRAH